MGPILLDKIAFRIDRDQLLKQLYVAPGTKDAEQATRLAEAAEAVARPKAICGVAFIDSKTEEAVTIEGITFTSRVLRVNLEQAHRVFPYVATCGLELDEWSESVADPFERYWADAIKEMALGVASAAVGEHLVERFQPGRTAVMAPGSLEDWPIQEQRQLFDLFGSPEDLIGVRLTEDFLMVPIKSISGMQFPTETGFQSCQLCPREKCPGRRAPYDPKLYDRRYRRTEVR